MSKTNKKKKSVHQVWRFTFFSCGCVPSLEFLEPCKHGLAYGLFVSVMIPNHRLLFPLLKRTCNDSLAQTINFRRYSFIAPSIKALVIPEQVRLPDQAYRCCLYSSPWAWQSRFRQSLNNTACISLFLISRAVQGIIPGASSPVFMLLWLLVVVFSPLLLWWFGRFSGSQLRTTTQCWSSTPTLTS